MNKALTTVTLATLLTTAASAAVISVNFDGAQFGGGASILGSSDVSGVEAVDNWNNVTGSSVGGSSTATALTDETGGATGTSLTYFERFWSDGTAGTTANENMTQSYTNTTTGVASEAMSFAGIGSAFTASGYDVIVYLGITDRNGPREFGVNIDGGTAQWIQVERHTNGLDTFSSTTFASEAIAAVSTTDSNYIRFTGITASSFSINFLSDSGLGDSERVGVRGIQLVAVPEPASVSLLLGTSCAALLLLRRRRRA